MFFTKIFVKIRKKKDGLYIYIEKENLRIGEFICIGGIDRENYFYQSKEYTRKKNVLHRCLCSINAEPMMGKI